MLSHSFALRVKQEPHLILLWGFLSFKALSHVFIKLDPYIPVRAVDFSASSDRNAKKTQKDESHGLFPTEPESKPKCLALFHSSPSPHRRSDNRQQTQHTLLGGNVVGSAGRERQMVQKSILPNSPPAKGKPVYQMQKAQFYFCWGRCLCNGLMLVGICIFWVYTNSEEGGTLHHAQGKAKAVRVNKCCEQTTRG